MQRGQLMVDSGLDNGMVLQMAFLGSLGKEFDQGLNKN
jgi:hypothetical protein